MCPTTTTISRSLPAIIGHLYRKDLAINDEIDKLRLAATSALLSGRKDVVVVSSVSCIYGMGNPADFYNNVIEVQQGKNSVAMSSCDAWWTVFMYATTLT